MSSSVSNYSATPYGFVLVFATFVSQQTSKGWLQTRRFDRYNGDRTLAKTAATPVTVFPCLLEASMSAEQKEPHPLFLSSNLLRAFDLLENRAEGETLSSALRLAGVQNRLLRPSNVKTLEHAFQLALDDFEPPPRGTQLSYPWFHFSAHGNENGFALTSDEFVRWEDLRQTLLAVARSIALFTPDEPCAMIQLSFSTCRGGYANRLFSFGPPYPCISVVGPEKEVSWPDSLTAFIVFFHLMFHKHSGARDAVASMNRACGAY